MEAGREAQGQSQRLPENKGHVLRKPATCECGGLGLGSQRSAPASPSDHSQGSGRTARLWSPRSHTPREGIHTASNPQNSVFQGPAMTCARIWDIFLSQCMPGLTYPQSREGWSITWLSRGRRLDLGVSVEGHLSSPASVPSSMLSHERIHERMCTSRSQDLSRLVRIWLT